MAQVWPPTWSSRPAAKHDVFCCKEEIITENVQSLQGRCRMAKSGVHFHRDATACLRHFHWHGGVAVRSDANFAPHRIYPNFRRFLFHFPHLLDPTLGNHDFGDAFCLYPLGVSDTTRWTEECTPFREMHHVLLVHHPTDVINCDNSLLDDCQWILGSSLSNRFCVLLGTSIELDDPHRDLGGLPPSIFIEEWNLVLDLYFHLHALDCHPLFLRNWPRWSLRWLQWSSNQRMSYLQCHWLEWTRFGHSPPRRGFRDPGAGTPLLRWSGPLPWPWRPSPEEADGWHTLRCLKANMAKPFGVELDLFKLRCSTAPALYWCCRDTIALSSSAAWKSSLQIAYIRFSQPTFARTCGCGSKTAEEMRVFET